MLEEELPVDDMGSNGTCVEAGGPEDPAAGDSDPATSRRDVACPRPEFRSVIIYRSKHRGNTKKLVDAIASAHPDIDVIDVAALGKNEYPDFSPYHLIVAASGIYFGDFDKDLLRVLQEKLRDGDTVLALMTSGGESKWNVRTLDGICRLKMANLLSAYRCPGLDCFGPFKLVGGMNKGRPNEEDIQGAVDFYDRVVRDYGDILVDERLKRDRRDAYDAAHQTGGFMADLKHTAKKIGRVAKKLGGNSDGNGEESR